MATKKLITKIVTQKMVSMDQTSLTVSKYPRYTVLLGNSISSITAGELTESVDKAAASAAAAKKSENNAKASEANAKISENNADTAATKSENSALRSEQAIELANAEADRAADEAAAALASKTVAQQAADNASQSKLLADQAKAAAEAAATDSRNSASAAKTSETNAASSAGTAKTEADKAAGSAAAAKISETNAAGSASAAAGSATSAGSEALTAEQEADRAKAEADRAAQVVNGKLDSTDIAPFVKLYKTLEEAQADLSHRNVGERILVWSKTASKYGWYKVISGDTGKSLSLELEEPRLLSVNNVQPDDAGNVQVTIPGGNPSLWLGEVTLFPYNKDSGVGYSGILPADGRLVLRVDYPDAWEAVDKGLVPSVTEAEWQAGAVMYFSKGTDDTNFRLPDMMRGQAFRAPVKNEEDAGEVKEQTPYVALVNKVAPDDTGNVNVDVGVKTVNGTTPDADGNIGGIAKSGVNKDITSLTGITSPITAPAATKVTELATLGQLQSSASDIRGAVWENATPLDNTDLDTVFEEGPYFQHSNSGATVSNHYPTSAAGSLLVLRNAANNALKGVTQIYYPYNSHRTYRRTFDGAALVWSLWKEYYMMGETIDYSGLAREAYDSVRLGTTEMGAKTYLRKFRGGAGDTIYHETVRSGQYRLAVGNSDTQTVFSVEHLGGTNVEAYLGDTKVMKQGDFGLGYGGRNLMANLGWTSGFLMYNTSAPEVPVNCSGWQSCYGPSRRAQLVVGTDSRLWVRFSLSDNIVDTDTPWKEIVTHNAATVTFGEIILSGNNSVIWSAGTRKSILDSWGSAKLNVAGGNLNAGFLPLASGTGLSPTGYNGNVIYGLLGRNDDTWPNPAIAVSMHDAGQAALFWNFKHGNGGLDKGVTNAELTVSRWDGTIAKSVAWQGTSDARLKKDIKDNDGTQSLQNITSLEFKSFVYISDEKERVRRGIVAQQAKEVDPDYVKLIEYGEDNQFDTYVVDNNPIIMDLVGSVQVLNAKIEEQDLKINSLTDQVDDQKTQIDSLTKQIEDLTEAVKILLGNSK